jgi:hypothetical protein
MLQIVIYVYTIYSVCILNAVINDNCRYRQNVFYQLLYHIGNIIM